MGDNIPEICGFDCPHAEFPPADTAGICRTMSAVWCGKLSALVNKNMPCSWRQSKAGKKTTKKITKKTAKKTAKKTTKKIAKKKAGGRKPAAKRPARRR